VNNAANLTISGPSAKILNGTANGLADFANNTGSFTVTADGNFTTGVGNFTNSNKVTVTAGSSMTVGGGYAYSQSAGTTTIDGTLTASSGINVTGGTIEGAGTLSGNVSVGGSGTTPALNIGDSGKAGLLVITGAYAQLTTASAKAFIVEQLWELDTVNCRSAQLRLWREPSLWHWRAASRRPLVQPLPC